MQNSTDEPTPCPDCGHFVYRPLVVSVCHPQHECRALTTPDQHDRCGCASAVHRTPTVRPRHRLEGIGVAS